MLTYSFESTGGRTLAKVKEIVANGGRVIDIGGANSFADGYLDAIVDIRNPQASAPNKFIGDMNDPEFWKQILSHKPVGWDYAICTHTLEDILNPLFVCRMIDLIADRGIIVVPSKHRELARFDPSFGKRGFWHHRWIFDMVDGVFTGFPKTNYIEDSRFDNVHKCLPEREELIVEWEGEINMHVVNDDLLYDSFEHFQRCYDALLKSN